jgi:uncharacterized protein YbjT (DUF2867 family)
MDTNKRVLITGGTGQQGRAAARAFAERGWQVRILTRDAGSDAAKALARDGAEIAIGNVEDSASLDAAMKSAEAVFCVVPLVTSFMQEGSFDSQYAGTVNVVNAAIRAGVDHFVLSSANSADKGLNPNTDNKYKMEQYIRSTGMRATFVRPCAFMDNFLLPQWGLHQGVFTSALLPQTVQQLVSTEDIAEFAAISIANPHAEGAHILEIAGDELTPGAMADALSQALGRRIPYIRIKEEVLLRFNPNSGRGYSKINAGVLRMADLDALRRLNPKLLSFPAWLERTGADRIRPLLPLDRPGAILGISPAWDLDAPVSSTKDDAELRPT